MSEFEQKQARLREVLEEHQLDAVLLQRASSFAWATCGSPSYVNTASTTGAASLLVTRSQRYLLTTNIEAERLEKEEHLSRQGWEYKINPWFENPTGLAQLTAGIKVGSDTPLPGMLDLTNVMARIRSNLTNEEIERFKELGKRCALGMNQAIRSLKPGMTEMEIAAVLGEEVQKRSAQPIVNLIATDERIYRYRHPLPTEKKLEQYALLVLCGRWKGLVCSISRLIYFGKLPADLRKKMEANARIDAIFHQATRPGVSLDQVFRLAVQAYADTGYPEEWKLHHQGGPTGYESREFLGRPDSVDIVKVNQAYAWNPSITGCKYEDTILVGESTNEVITEIPGWPTLSVDIGGQRGICPAILQIS